LKKIFLYIGDNTLIILALHYPFYKIFEYYYVDKCGSKLTESIMGG